MVHPLKWFTYGTIIEKGGMWYRYWMLRLPGLYWAYSPTNDEMRWMNPCIRWTGESGYGLIGRWRFGYCEVLK